MKWMAPYAGLLALTLGLLTAACTPVPRRATPSPNVPTVIPPNAPDAGSIGDAVPGPEPRSASGNPPFYVVAGRRYIVLSTADGYVERGVASWYGADFHGLRTATGEKYDMFAMTAAHKTLPLPCYARITNLSNGRSIVVRINDRGPFVANRIIDLSYTAASKLDMIRNGTAFVQVETLSAHAPAPSAELPAVTPAASAANVGVSNVPPVTAQLPPAATPAVTAAGPSAPDNAAAPSAHFYIQVGAYGQAENARRIEQKLRDAGLKQAFTLGATAEQPLLRVRIGPIDNVQEFDRLIARLSALGIPDARLAQD
jgi:rare lipoprotein A